MSTKKKAKRNVGGMFSGMSYANHWKWQREVERNQTNNEVKTLTVSEIKERYNHEIH